MRNKIVTADEAVALIRDGDSLCNAGFVGNGTPDELLAALERRFLETGGPVGLTLLFAAGQGDGKERGLNRLAHEGLLKRVIGGHWGLIPKVAKLAVDNRIEAYNLPQGTISHLYRDIAAGKPGVISKVGIGTFVDPRLQGGRINEISTEAVVELINLAGEEWLFTKAFPLKVAFIRATSADANGNLTMEREALTLDGLAMAQAVRNSGGLVIAQVERIVESGSLHPRAVKVPGILVDCVVVAKPENHMQTYATQYSPAFANEIRVPLGGVPAMAMSERKITARRAAFELPMGGVVNLGIGMPDGVAAVAAEENILKYLTLTTEPGVVGGLPAGGMDFGAASNVDAIIDQNQQFDFYDGGGLDLACLGLAQADAQGNVNVSRFGPRLAGAGGFINISQNARRVVFVGTFTAGDVEIAVEDGRVRIVKEGKSVKFVKSVDQVTFSGAEAIRRDKPVLYVTERCVLRLTQKGLLLAEVAPGIDIERDILPYMEFAPLIDSPQVMDPRLFLAGPMGLDRVLRAKPLAARVTYDAGRNLLFLNFEGLRVTAPEHIEAIQTAVEERCRQIGRRVDVVVNYDDFHLDDSQADAYAAMVRHMVASWYGRITRYTTSAFLRAKLGAALEARGQAPHIYETEAEAEEGLIRS